MGPTTLSMPDHLEHNPQFQSQPALSAYAYPFGPYNFNKSTMAPSGTRVIVHNQPGNRTSWGHTGTPGWYIGTLIDHYRCMQY